MDWSDLHRTRDGTRSPPIGGRPRAEFPAYAAWPCRMKIGKCRRLFVRYPVKPGYAATYRAHILVPAPVTSVADTDKVRAPTSTVASG